MSFSQNSELFSKIQFSFNKYHDMDLSSLDITNTRDFATYMALVSNGQGKGGEKALDAFYRKTNNSSLAQWCQRNYSNG